MREIKFRVWDKINERMKENAHLLDSFNEYLARPNEWTCEQYTGIKDKNGVEIYEGDILSKTEGSKNREVSFAKGQFEIGKGQPLWTWEQACEVIGNIHESEAKP